MNPELEKILKDLKEALPTLVGMKAKLEGHEMSLKEMADMKSRIEKLDGDLVAVGKNFTDMLNLQKTRETGAEKELSNEQKFDFIKLTLSIFKQGKNPHSQNESTIDEINKKYPAQYKASNVEGTSADGGYLIPTLFSKFIWRAAEQASIALQEAQIMPLGKGYKLPLTRIDSDVAVYFESEAADISAHISKPTLSQADLTAKKLMGHVILSNELLEDEPEGLMDEVGSTTIIDWIINLFGEAMGSKIDNEAFAGTGTNFTGVLYTSGVNKVIMAHGKGTFNDLTFDDLSNMISKLKVSQLAGAKFYLSKTVLHSIRTLKDNNGNYIWSPPTLTEPGTIWGYPYRVSEQMPEVAASAISTPFLFFGNMKKYVIGSKGNMTMRFDTSIKSFTDESVLFVRRRIAMLTALPAAFCILSTNSTET